jgi:hypothetical protein
MLGNGTGTELGVEVEAVTENRVPLERVSEAKVLTFAGFRDLFGGAGLTEARMSAALVGMGCIGQPSTQKYAQ